MIENVFFITEDVSLKSESDDVVETFTQSFLKMFLKLFVLF